MNSVEAARRFVAAAAEPSTSDDDLQSYARQFFETLNATHVDDAGRAMGVVAEAIGVPEPRRATLAAMICGSMVEKGADPAPMAGPLLERLRTAASAARRLHEAYAAKVPADLEDMDEQHRLLESAREQALAAMPCEAEGWKLLEDLCAPTAAVLSASPGAWNDQSDLIADVQAVEGEHPTAGWIVELLRVLRDEPYVVIEAGTNLGIVGRMTGVSSNFQLHMLLMDQFPRSGWLSRRRISPEAAAVARGDAPSRPGETVTGTWNLYAWTALKPGGRLPEATDLGERGDWIWGEGVPADIPPFDGHRVILLGPPAYSRTWGASRTFERMKARLSVNRQLNKAEVREWLDRMAAAPK